MTVSIEQLAEEINPAKTALLLGAGSSIPSGAPTGVELAQYLANDVGEKDISGLSLSEVASLIELKHDRPTLINSLRKKIYPLSPSGGVVDLPLYKWKDIYTTNYDNIIEKSYAGRKSEYVVISTNYDFGRIDDIKQNIFKIHGTIDKDVVDHSFSRMIVTQSDYVLAEEYREDIYGRLLAAGSTSNLLIVGHSLSDPDLNALIQEAVRRRTRSGSIGRVFALIYDRDENRALLVEQKGVRVAFGSLDEFLAALAGTSANAPTMTDASNPVQAVAGLSSTVVSVDHALVHGRSDPTKMFYGSPATYADISERLVFDRDMSLTLVHKLAHDRAPITVLLGVAGVGKTTLARQVLSKLSLSGIPAWEHINGTALSSDRWILVAKKLASAGTHAVLFVDDAHRYIAELGKLADFLAIQPESYLHLVCCSSKAHWNHRTKSDGFLLSSTQVELRRLSSNEIDNLLDLFERDHRVAALADKDFRGFSRLEKKRRLTNRCSSDFFVCLRNIFSNDLIDHIILSEYASLDPAQQEVYRLLSALEASGVMPHRQHIIRAVGIDANNITRMLEEFDGMIEESEFDASQGLFVWKGRHPVVSEIIRKSKFSDADKYIGLLESFIDNVNPTYEIERHNLIEICDAQGIGRINSRDSQNFLFRKIISKSPSLRVPRHRLISNLINSGDYEPASNEIRIFESDLGQDGPVARLKALIPLRRAQHVKGIMEEDRIALIAEGLAILRAGINRYKNDKRLYESYCEAGIQNMKFGGGWSALDEALSSFETRAAAIDDAEFSRSMNKMKLRIRQIQSGSSRSDADTSGR